MPTASPGVVFKGSAPAVYPVTATIGGVAANVLYAGLVSAGLYQLNVALVAEVAGVRTPCSN